MKNTNALKTPLIYPKKRNQLKKSKGQDQISKGIENVLWIMQ
jgi:hypothetical protein